MIDHGGSPEHLRVGGEGWPGVPRTEGALEGEPFSACPPDTPRQIPPMHTELCGHQRPEVRTQPTSDLKHANLKHIQHSPETRKLIKLLNHLHFKTSLYSVELQMNEADLRNNLGL